LVVKDAGGLVDSGEHAMIAGRAAHEFNERNSRITSRAMKSGVLKAEGI
jgi:hypothetical protein